MDTLPVEYWTISSPSATVHQRRIAGERRKRSRTLQHQESSSTTTRPCSTKVFLRLRKLPKSRLAKYVKRLTYFNDTLPVYRKMQSLASVDFRPDFHTFTEQRKDDFPDEIQDWQRSFTGRTDVFSRAFDAWQALPRHDLSKKTLEEGWREFTWLLKEQNRWGRKDQNSRLQAAFRSLPSLVEVDVVRATSENRHASQWPIWKRLRENVLLGPSDWKAQMTPSEEMIDFGNVLETATLCLLEAIAQRDRERDDRVKPISVIRIQNDMSLPNSLVANWTKSLYGSAPGCQQWSRQLTGPLPLADAFRHITSFTVRLTDPGSEASFPQMAAIWAQLHHFLAVASKLKRLTVLLEGDVDKPQFDEDLHESDEEDPIIRDKDSSLATDRTNVAFDQL